MKRGFEESNPPNGSLMSKQSAVASYFVDGEDQYSVSGRVVRFTPTDLNSRITKNAPSIRFIKAGNILVDFEINDKICVYVRRIDEYMKQPSEIFRLLEQQKNKERQIMTGYVLRVFILIMDNLVTNDQVVQELSAKCALSELSLLLCWNCVEAGSLIGTMKIYEERGDGVIRKQVGTDIRTQAVNILTNIEGVNKDNAEMLIMKYTTMADIMTAELGELEDLPGLGTRRVLGLIKAFQQVKE